MEKSRVHPHTFMETNIYPHTCGAKGVGVKDAVIAVTYSCNSHCRMCNIWQMQNPPQLENIDNLNNLPESLQSINITGGEPFLYPNLEEGIWVITKRCPQASLIISSNGFATERIIATAKKLIRVKSDIGIAISLDGVGEAHAAIRGIPDAYAKVIATLKNLQSIGIKNLKVSFTIGDYNHQELPKVYALAREMRLEFSLAVVHSSENYFGQENTLNNKEAIIRELEWLIRQELSGWNFKKWARAYFAWGAIEFIRTGKRILPDYSGQLNIFIDPRGDIYPCDVSSQKIGNLSDPKSFKKIDVSQECEQSWMVCTARQAIKKHWFKTLAWILARKLKLFLNICV